MYFAPNIKLLRKRRKRTQDDIAQALSLKRSTLSGYENGVAQPNIEALILFSDFFKISIDTLLRIDLRQVSEQTFTEIENGHDVYIRGGQLRVLATTVDSENVENIELVPEKAKAGYQRGYADPAFVGDLPKFQLPFLDKNRKYRTFQITGDSMLPIPDKAWVTGEFVMNWNQIKTGTACIVLTLNDGIVFKVVENYLSDKRGFELHSLNPSYVPYFVAASEVTEIWKFTHYISQEMPLATISQGDIIASISQLRKDIYKIKGKLDLE